MNKKLIIDDSNHESQYPESRRVGEKEESLQIIQIIRKKCDERNDNFAANVRKRPSISTDLVADEAVYHIQYYAQFFLNTRSADGNRGSPEFLKMQAVF